MSDGAAISRVDENVRRQFESDWKFGKPSSIDAYLPAPESNEHLATLEELVCIEMEFLWNESKKKRAVDSNADTVNDASTRPTYVEDYTRRFPVLSDSLVLQRLVEHEIEVRAGSEIPPSRVEFKRRFPDLDLPERLFGSSNERQNRPSVRSGRPFSISDKDLPRWFGRYHLTAVLGKGGMATVYRAKQHQTDREVAVKIAHLPEHGNVDEFRSRFLKEAKAASAITHDNVAPVYDVGEVNGQPFYTMPIIDGGDLAQQLSAGPIASRLAARQIKDAATGVSRAHQNGVLHRDLKPSNLMIDVRNDRVMVADFGLAREMSSGEVGLGDQGSVQALTRTGQILGTPSYMAPEQIRDARVADAGADIYSLGATLYHALTGKPPFQASTPMETLHQVLHDDPVSPRQLNTEVCRDLDTIVMKCLDKEVTRRYASASELSDDLERYLNGQPIVARPLGIIQRSFRWCRRNKKTASLLAALAAAAILAVSAMVYALSAETKRARNNLANSKLAFQMLDETYAQLMADFSNQGGMTTTRREYLERSRKFYNAFAELADQPGATKADLARVLVRLGEVNTKLHRSKEAFVNFEDALNAVGQASAKEVGSVDLLLAESDAQNGIGQALAAIGENEKALAAFEKSGKLRKTLWDQASMNIEFGRKYANSLMNQGFISARLGAQNAEDLQTRAQEIRKELLEREPQNLRVIRDLGKGSHGLAILANGQGSDKLALQRIKRATATFEKLCGFVPHDADAWMQLVRCKLEHSMIADIANDPQAGEPLKEAVKLADGLARMASYSWDYRMELIPVNLQGVQMLLDRNEVAQAQECHEIVVELFRDDLGLEVDKDSAQYQRYRLIHEIQGGRLELAQGKESSSRMSFQKAIKRWENAPESLRDDPDLEAEIRDVQGWLSSKDVL